VAGAPSPTSKPRGRDGVDTATEVAIGLILVALIGSLIVAGWRFYDTYVLPQARVIPTATSTPVPDPEAVKAQARRIRVINDHVGAGIAFRQANRRDLATQEFLEALALDPANFEARQNLSEMGIEPPVATAMDTPVPPTPTVVPTATPRR
jgi:hypothetical protein